MLHLRPVAVALATACALSACAGHNSTGGSSARTNAGVRSLLTAVFAHPQAAQCTSAMTSRYVSQTFGDEAARSGTSPMMDCRQHQRVRAELPAAERAVTVRGVSTSGASVRAIVRGSNGYPFGITLVRRGRRWRLDTFGPAAQARGSGPEVSPTDSVYAYRIPPGFVSGGTALGAVDTSGAAFSTSVVLPGERGNDGVAVAQTVIGSGIHDQAALRMAIPRLDRGVRGSLIARSISAPVAESVGGRLAVSWDLVGEGPASAHTDGKTVFVFSSAANAVIVNCRWPQAGPDRAVLRHGCEAVLGTLSVG